MDAGRHGHGHANPGGLHQQGDGLQGMSHDEGRLGIAAGLLMQAFDPRHFAALFGALEAIGQHDRATVDPHLTAAEQVLEGLPPQAGQPVQIHRRGMEEVEQAVIAGVGQAEAADQAGHPRQIGAQTQRGQNEHQPQERGGAGAGRPEALDGAQPGQPEEGGALSKRGAKRVVAHIRKHIYAFGI